MSISNYSELQAAVADWAARADSAFTGRASDFITLAEERIWRELRVSKMLTTATLTVPATTNAVDLPADWLEFYQVTGDVGGNGNQPLEYLPPTNLLQLSPSGDGGWHYTIIGDQLRWSTGPSSDTDIQCVYYAQPTALSSTSTNWLLTKYPSVYLWASLIEAMVFLKNSAKAGEFGTLYDKAVSAIETADAQAMSSGSPLRVRAR